MGQRRSAARRSTAALTFHRETDPGHFAMPWTSYCLFSLPNAVLGLIVGTYASHRCLRWLRVSNGPSNIIPQEARWALLGALIGLVSAVIAVGKTRPQTSSGFARAAGAAVAAVLIPTQAATAGGDIAERIRRFNATPEKDDPDYLGAADVSTRFIPWFMAVTKLRAKDGGDFVSELRTILELSREPKDSVAMQQDVCRVASHALFDWAGVAPLATDPEPR